MSICIAMQWQQHCKVTSEPVVQNTRRHQGFLLKFSVGGGEALLLNLRQVEALSLNFWPLFLQNFRWVKIFYEGKLLFFWKVRAVPSPFLDQTESAGND